MTVRALAAVLLTVYLLVAVWVLVDSFRLADGAWGSGPESGTVAV